MAACRRPQARGITLIELLLAVAIVAILALMAAPSFRDLMLMQRLRGINAQLVTDMQFARSEAVQRATAVRVVFRSSSDQTCYSIFTTATPVSGVRCDCLLGAGVACGGGTASEVRTVAVPRTLGVTVTSSPPPTSQNVALSDAYAFGFSGVTGGLISIPSDTVSVPIPLAQLEGRIDDARRLRTDLSAAGRASVCAPGSSGMQVPPCP